MDLKRGTLAEKRVRLLTPHPATPDAVGRTVTELVEGFGWHDKIGCTFPAVITSGTARTASNVDAGWAALLPEDPCLRSLSWDWPLGMLKRQEDQEQAKTSPALPNSTTRPRYMTATLSAR